MKISRKARAERSRSVCVLLSGGLDSAVLLKDCLERYREVHPLYLSAGLRWEKAELYWVGRLLKRLKRPGLKPLVVVTIPGRTLYGKHWSLGDRPVPGERARNESVYLPARNLLLFSLAAAYCAQHGVGNIAIGTLEGNPFNDASESFYEEMEAVFRRLFGGIRLLAPLRHLHKDEVVKRSSGVPLELTFSCIDPRGLKPCGHCSKCGERKKGFNDPVSPERSRRA